MSLRLIVAMDRRRLIGKEQGLPWKLPEDLQRFKTLTMGRPVLMGRKTFESLGRPLPGRDNMVLSHRLRTPPEGVTLYQDWESAFAAAEKGDGFVIGGKTLFEIALPRVDRAYVTLVEGEYQGDTFFPEVDWEKDFVLDRQSGPRQSKTGVKFEYFDYVRRA